MHLSENSYSTFDPISFQLRNIDPLLGFLHCHQKQAELEKKNGKHKNELLQMNYKLI